MPDPTCQRCGKSGNVGPWNGEGEGGHTLLCGLCKVEVTMAMPGTKDKLRRNCEALAKFLKGEQKDG